MDTDVEVLKPIDDILSCQAVSGFEAKDRIPTGLMACEKDQPLFVELLKDYDDAHFVKEDGSYDMTTNVERITKVCLKYGLKLDNTLQTVNGFTLFPNDYFCPKDSQTKKLTITKNTYTIHHFDGSWLSEEDKICAKLERRYGKIMPKRLAGYLAKFNATVKTRGLKVAMKEFSAWRKRKKGE